MKDFIKKVFITSLLIFGCLFCMPFSNHQVDAKAMTPAEEWKANSFPSEDWTTDNYTYHKVGFINDSNHKQLLLYIDMYPISKKNKNDNSTDQNQNDSQYKKMMPSGYEIKIGNNVYDLSLDVYSHLYSIQKDQTEYSNIGIWDRTRGIYTTSKDACRLNSDNRYNHSVFVTIPYSMFNDKDINGSTTITLKNANLGNNQEITVTGASTFPYIPVIIAIILASITVVIYYHKKESGHHEQN